ncbi:hypothetical protein L9F63_015311, partial [Diploptera punctata]
MDCGCQTVLLPLVKIPGSNSARRLYWNLLSLSFRSTSLALLFIGLDSPPTPWPAKKKRPCNMNIHPPLENPFTTSLASCPNVDHFPPNSPSTLHYHIRYIIHDSKLPPCTEQNSTDKLSQVIEICSKRFEKTELSSLQIEYQI